MLVMPHDSFRITEWVKTWLCWTASLFLVASGRLA